MSIMSKEIKIAITGTIGSGKTTVSDYIRDKGYYVFDADKVNAELLLEGNLGYLEVKKHFPEAFDGNMLNKAKLASIVFENDDKRKELEDIMHPLILDVMNIEAKKHKVFFAEIPLLFEANWDKYFDYSFLVVADREIALNRLVLRGLSKKESNRRIKNQMNVELKKKRATEIIYNNSNLKDLYKEVDKLLDKYVR